jgi:Periplasmic protein TonB, links inner and outer membranes
MKRLLSYFVSVSFIGAAVVTGCLSHGVFAQPGGSGAIVAVEESAGLAGSKTRENAGGSAVATTGKYSSTTKSSVRNGSKKARSKPQAAAPQPRLRKAEPFNGPVLGDKYTFLNFEVISAAKPIYRLKAKQAGASGLVQVEVLINENGDVINAKARTGNRLLWDEAESAALASKFNRPTDNGRPARATGFLVYRFGKGDEDDDEP